MYCYVEFITTPTTDHPGTALVLHFNEKRYLIGQMSEGVQRACFERGIGLRKTSSILLTGRMRWSNVGGLLGMILALAETKIFRATQDMEELKKRLGQNQINDVDKLTESSKKLLDQSKVNIYGPSNLKHMIATARRFIFRRGMPMDVHEPKNLRTEPPYEPTWKDDCVRVWVLPLRPTSATNAGGGGPRPRKRSHDELEEIPNSSTTSVPDTSGDDAIRQNLVSKMFNSDWQPDRLIAQRLSEVKMPATIFVKDPQSKNLVKYTGPMPGDNEAFADIEVLVREPWPSSLIENLPRTTPELDAISYIIKNHPQRGKFMPEVATELKVPKGPLWSNLSKGLTVQNSDGRDITPDMVLQPGKEGGGFAVIDLPDASYIDSFLQRPEWKVPEVMNGVGVIIWVLAPGLASDERIQKFQTKMSHLKHLISSPDCCTDRSPFGDSLRTALLHNHLESKIFPLLQEPDLPTVCEDQKDPNIAVAKPGLTVVLEPSIQLSTKNVVPPLDIASAKSQIAKDLRALDDIAKASERKSNKASLEPVSVPYGDAEITVLGTGSSSPSKYRNVSGTLVRVPGLGSYLFDCGEGALGTLKRIFSPLELKTVLQDLKMVWISHLHADHHLGVTSVLKARRDAIEDQPALGKLAVVSDTAFLQWLHEYSWAEDIGISNILPLVATPLSRHANGSGGQETSLRYLKSAERTDLGDSNSTSMFLKEMNLKSLKSVFVNHCRGAQAVSVTFENGLKVSYSGDCRPSASFARIGRNSHVLIHEATLEDSLRSEAISKKHCTLGEALIVASEMKAQACLLTHFSQRYPTMPPGTAAVSPRSRPSSPVRDLSGVLEEVEDESQQPSALAGDEENNSATAAAADSLPGDAVDNKVAPKPPRHPLASPGRSSRTLLESMTREGRIQKLQTLDLSDVRRLVEANKIQIVVAFDYMRLKLRDIPRAVKLQPVLRKFYDYSFKNYHEPGGSGSDEDKGKGQAGQRPLSWTGAAQQPKKKQKDEKGKKGGDEPSRANKKSQQKKKEEVA